MCHLWIKNYFASYFTVKLPPRGHRTYVDYPNPELHCPRFDQEVERSDVSVDETIGKGEILKQYTFLAILIFRIGRSLNTLKSASHKENGWNCLFTAWFYDCK